MIELCPDCNAPLSNEFLSVMPPIEIRRCRKCGGTWYKVKSVEKTEIFNPEGWEKK